MENLSFYAVFYIFFFLTLPGYFFKRFYFSGEFSKQFGFAKNILINLATCSVIGLILLFAMTFLFNVFAKNPFDVLNILDFIDTIIIGKTASASNPPTLSYILNVKTLAFLLYIYICSSIAGLFIQTVVYKLKLDTKFKILRFQNDWHYIFSGRILHTQKWKSNNHLETSSSSKNMVTRLDVLTSNNGSETTLFSGFLVDYDLSQKDPSKLERLHLVKAERWKEGASKLIPGTFFTIQNDCIKNINTTYIELEHNNDTIDLQYKIVIALNIICFVFILFMAITILFKIHLVETAYFNTILEASWILKIYLIYLLLYIQFVFIPFDVKDNKTSFIGWKELFKRGFILFLLSSPLLIYILQG